MMIKNKLHIFLLLLNESQSDCNELIYNICNKNSIEYRIIHHNSIITMDFNFNRINFYIKDDKIYKIDIG